jgi:hypothetical protein
MLPEFNKLNGCLPKGIHDATWAEVEERFGETEIRKNLLRGLLTACIALRTAGAAYLFLDGSFVTSKTSPGDWDACFSRVGINSALLDPVFLDYANDRAAQKAKFGGETFIAESKAAGLLGPPYLEFFQKEKKTGRPKGIVRLGLGTIP